MRLVFGFLAYSVVTRKVDTIRATRLEPAGSGVNRFVCRRITHQDAIASSTRDSELDYFLRTISYQYARLINSAITTVIILVINRSKYFARFINFT